MPEGVAGWAASRSQQDRETHGSLSRTLQPQLPGAALSESAGQPSTQSAMPSESASVWGTPHPQLAGASFRGSFGQPSWQSRTPSESESTSGRPQPQAPGAALA